MARNEYQEYFLRGKGGRCVGLTLPPSRVNCLELKLKKQHIYKGTAQLHKQKTQTKCEY